MYGSPQTVAATTALVSEGLPEEARLIIEGELERDEARPVDHAWLTAQHARLCLDLGDARTARADAGQILSIGATTPGDVTAAAIAGSGAIVLFNTASWQEQLVSTVVTAADTTASWWRAQITATGLEAVAERGFSAWARDRSITIAAEDVANNRLLSAALLASNAADHGGWRHLSGLLGCDMLMRLDRHADRQSVEEVLGTLRLAGAESEIKLAVQQLVANGPASAVTEAARQVDLERSTRTTLLANLSLLRYAADVLDSETVESSVAWLIPRAADPSHLERLYGTYYLELATGGNAVSGGPGSRAEAAGRHRRVPGDATFLRKGQSWTAGSPVPVVGQPGAEPAIKGLDYRACPTAGRPGR